MIVMLHHKRESRISKLKLHETFQEQIHLEECNFFFSLQ